MLGRGGLRIFTIPKANLPSDHACNAAIEKIILRYRVHFFSLIDCKLSPTLEHSLPKCSEYTYKSGMCHKYRLLKYLMKFHAYKVNNVRKCNVIKYKTNARSGFSIFPPKMADTCGIFSRNFLDKYE